MSVIRMIKLFGWEPRVADQLAEKRESELKYIRMYKILELINNNIKCVFVSCTVHTVLSHTSLSFVIPVITMVATFATYVCPFSPLFHIIH